MNISPVALREVEEALGADNVSTAEETRGAATQNTYEFGKSASCVVRPGSTAEVSAVVLWAGKHGLRLYVSSRGRNWGYGSRVPPEDHVVLVDLSRMNAIVAIDEDLAYARVQCGVSFAELSEALRARDARVMLSSIGGPPDSSLVGNIIERGLGKGVYGDRFLSSCNFEVVLADGRVIQTGFGALANARAAPVHRWGLGVSLDGLFTQSSFGIVTEVTLWLQRRAKHHVSAMFWIDDDARIGKLVEAVRELRLEGTLTSTSLLANDLRRLSFLQQYPWDAAGGATPLPRDVRLKLRSIGAWSGDCTLYGATPALVAAARARVEEVLAPLTDGIVFSDSLEGASDHARRSVLAVHSLASGNPLPLAGSPVYWRVKATPHRHSDPHADGCGLLWFSPALPMSAEAATWCTEAAERIVSEHGFEPNIGLNCFSDRAFDCTTMIVYDRGVAGEDRRALECYSALLKAFAEQGYYPYRMPIGMNHLLDGYRREGLGAQLRAALDPAGVFAGGRYLE
ncbi:MAG: putative oxidoreductase [Labilithrix sp.]|nr:putative oxidoreductase [Labilithrix sp.]